MKLFFHYCVQSFSNTYLVGEEDGSDALLVDPGSMDVNLLNLIEKSDYYVRAILLTHNHRNHVHGVRTLMKIYNADIYSSSTEIEGYRCKVVKDGDHISFNGKDIEVLSVPGHSSDSVAYKIDHLIFTGDAISAGFVGETVSAYGKKQLVSSIRQKIMSQCDECVLLPGHGPPSTVRAERLFNIGLNPADTERPSPD